MPSLFPIDDITPSSRLIVLIPDGLMGGPDTAGTIYDIQEVGERSGVWRLHRGDGHTGDRPDADLQHPSG